MLKRIFKAILMFCIKTQPSVNGFPLNDDEEMRTQESN